MEKLFGVFQENEKFIYINNKSHYLLHKSEKLALSSSWEIISLTFPSRSSFSLGTILVLTGNKKRKEITIKNSLITKKSISIGYKVD